MQEHLKYIQHRLGVAESRRLDETALFSSDLINIKRRVAVHEQYMNQLKQMVDNSEADRLIDTLSRDDNDKLVDLEEMRMEIDKIGQEIEGRRRVK